MTIIQRIQSALYHKDFQLVQQYMHQVAISSEPLPSQIFLQYTSLKLQLQKLLQKRKQQRQGTGDQYDDYKTKIKQIQTKYSLKNLNKDILQIHTRAMQGFLLQILSGSTENKDREQSTYYKDLIQMRNITEFYKNTQVLQLVQNSLYFSMSLLQLYTQRSTRMKRKQQKQQISILLALTNKFFKKFPQTFKLCQKLHTILMHLYVHYSNTHSQDLSQEIITYIDLSCERLSNHSSKNLMKVDTVIVLLYNALKLLLGFNEVNNSIMQKLAKIYVIQGLTNCGKNYSMNILQLFFIIKILIFRDDRVKSEAEEKDYQIKASSSARINEPKQMQESKAQDFRISQLNQKFSSFLNINLDQVIVQLNQIARSIVRHKVASLATIIQVKLGIHRFNKDFLQVMHDSAFNNDIQTIKLCFELFQFQEFKKLQNLLKIVLSVPGIKNVNQKQVLIAMCSIFNSFYLQNRQEGILYSKLNHQNFISNRQANSRILNDEEIKMHRSVERREILKQQTFLQHLGFGYYNMFAHETYLDHKKLYMIKALENFIKSYELNNQNYLLNYCIAKIYLYLHDYDNAYKYAMESCRSHRGSWVPFCLLACIYMCQRKIQKSIIIIDQLIKKHPQQAVLYYIRAYVQVNKLLLEVEHDEEIGAAHMLGEQFYSSHFDKILKSKSFHNILTYCQNYYQLSTLKQFSQTDQNFFTNLNIRNDGSEGEPCLLKIMKLFIEIQLYSHVENIVKYLPNNYPPAMFYRALLHQKRKQYKLAKSQYIAILNIDPCYYEAMIRIALLLIQQQDRQMLQNSEQTSLKQTKISFYTHNSQHPSNEATQSLAKSRYQQNNSAQKLHVQQTNPAYEQALYYLEMAQKFTYSSDFVLAKGLVYSKIGKIKQANQLLLQTVQTCWIEQLPHLLYYY